VSGGADEVTGRRAIPGSRTPSPSGSYLLELVTTVEEGGPRPWEYLHVRVLDTDGKVVFETPERFAAWFPVNVSWDERDRVWLASGDEGVAVWAAENGRWKRYVWDSGAPEEPSPERTVWSARLGEAVPVIGGEPPPALQEARR
jgi:hypothetical protein